MNNKILLIFILPIFHILIMIRCMKSFFGSPQKSKYIWIPWFIYYIVQICFSYIRLSVLAIFINIFFMILLGSVSFNATLKHKCIFSALLCLIWMVIEVLISSLLYSYGLSGDEGYTLGSFISKLCMLMFPYCTEHFLHKNKRNDISTRYFMIILIIPMTSIYMMHNILFFSHNHPEYSHFTTFSCILLLLVSYVIFYVYDWMMRDSEIQEENRLYSQQLKLCTQQAQERESYYLDLRRIRHDLKNHLYAILGMLESNDIEGSKKYIESLLDSGINSNIKDLSKSGNIIVDSLVNYKLSKAKQYGIDCNTNIFLPAELPFESVHLTIIYGNLLENAIEACLKLDDAKKYIELDTYYAKDVLFITVKNPYIGNYKRDVHGKFISTKNENLSWHGLGLSSVEQAVSHYHGELEINTDHNVFQVVIVMYGIH